VLDRDCLWSASSAGVTDLRHSGRGIGWGQMGFWAVHVVEGDAVMADDNVHSGGAGLDVTVDCAGCSPHRDGTAASSSISSISSMLDAGGSMWQQLCV